MKNSLYVLLALFCVGCGVPQVSQVEEPESPQVAILDTVQTISTFRIEESLESIIGKEYYGHDQKILRRDSYSDTGTISDIQIFLYDSNIKPYQSFFLDRYGDTTHASYHSFRDNGTTEIMETYWKGEFSSTYYFYRDENGKSLSSAGYDGKGELFDSNTFDLNSQGLKKIERAIMFNYYSEFEYNEHGDIISKRTINKGFQYTDIEFDSSEIPHYIYVYEYDNHGNWIDKKEYRASDTVNHWRHFRRSINGHN
ncbi:MAG: hypothetical protein P8M05_03380 [Flavobacteriales bacterium]|nr:hypothetical protein [Flavobacteriales bacterium]